MKRTITLIALCFGLFTVKAQDSTLLFNGTTDYIISEIGLKSLSITNEFTIETIIRIDSFDRYQSICQWGECLTQNSSISLTINNKNKLSLGVNNDGHCKTLFNAIMDSALNSIKTAECMHVAVTFKSPNVVKFYIDGKEYSSTDNGYSVSTINNTSDSLRVGAYKGLSGNFNYFNGAMKKFKMYNKALSAKEIGSIYFEKDIKFISLKLDYILNYNPIGQNQFIYNRENKNLPGYTRGTKTTPYAVIACRKNSSIGDFSPINAYLYPNPAQSSLTIKGINLTDNITIEIYGIQGNLILSESARNNIIDVSNIPTGMYFIVAKGKKGETLFVDKFVKE